jgi:hypothetical protein
MAHATKRAVSSRDQEWGRETFRRYWWAEKLNLGEDSTEAGKGKGQGKWAVGEWEKAIGESEKGESGKGKWAIDNRQWDEGEGDPFPSAHWPFPISHFPFQVRMSDWA